MIESQSNWTENKLERATKTKMVENAVLSLRNYILDGNVAPGTELPPESEMASQIGVSKFIMREALRVLEVLGLVKITQGKRTRVAAQSMSPIISVMQITFQRSKAPMIQLLEARKSLEGHISRFAALRANPEHIEAMEKTLQELDSCREDIEVCVDNDILFHNILVKASNNLVFEMMLAPLSELLRDSRREQIRIGGIDRVIKYHRLILSALKDRDPVRAEECMNLHLEKAEEDVRKIESAKG